MSIPISLAHDYFLSLQEKIAKRLSLADGKAFATDKWQRDEGGGGVSRYLENGALFARAAVLFSHVKGHHWPPSATAQRRDLKGRRLGAVGGALESQPTARHIPTRNL